MRPAKAGGNVVSKDEFGDGFADKATIGRQNEAIGEVTTKSCA